MAVVCLWSPPARRRKEGIRRGRLRPSLVFRPARIDCRLSRRVHQHVADRQSTTQRRHSMAVAPLQFVFLGLRGDEQRSEVTKTLRSLSDRGAIRVLDIAYMTKQEDRTFTPAQEYTTMTDQERQQLGPAVRGLGGLGYGGRDGGEPGPEQGARAGRQT